MEQDRNATYASNGAIELWTSTAANASMLCNPCPGQLWNPFMLSAAILNLEPLKPNGLEDKLFCEWDNCLSLLRVGRS